MKKLQHLIKGERGTETIWKKNRIYIGECISAIPGCLKPLQGLPIGSVVTLEEGKHKLMIFGVKQTHSETGKLYDYAGVLYPEGNVGTEYQMLFNHDKIKSIEFRGYENEERERFIKKLGEILEEKGE